MNPMTTIGDYELTKSPLAQDWQGVLYQGRNVKDGQPALVKQLFMPPREEGEQWSAIKETALLLPQAAVQHEKSSYRVIGNADGELLGAVIPTLQSQGIWGRYLLLTTFLSVCRAVENLHAVGKVHGAIHPNHVLVRKDSSACLLCFHPMPIRLEKIDPYRNDFLVNLSQEQLRGFGSPATDVYGLGVLLFQVFGDALPYSATSPYDLAEQTMRSFLCSIHSETRLLVADQYSHTEFIDI